MKSTIPETKTNRFEQAEEPSVNLKTGQITLSPRDMHMGVTEGEDTEGSWGKKKGTVTKTWLRNSQRREETDHSTKNLNKL